MKPESDAKPAEVAAQMALYADAPKLERWPTATEEVWLAKKLGLRHRLFEGTTTPESRREHVRSAILEQDLADQVAGGESRGRPETWRALFERVYGVAL